MRSTTRFEPLAIPGPSGRPQCWFLPPPGSARSSHDLPRVHSDGV